MTPRIDLIGIVTRDLPASLAFYRRLGLDIPPEADGRPHVEAVLPGGLRIAWDTEDTVRSFDPERRMPPGEGRISLAFRCEEPAEVDRCYAELVAEGYTGRQAPWDAFWGQRYALLLDPDGNGVDLFSPLGTVE